MTVKKKKKKRRHLNKKLIPFIIVLIALIVTIIIGNVALKLKLIGDKEIYLEIYDQYFENGYSASFFGNEIDVETTNNINNLRFGDYEVTYKARAGIFSKKAKRIVHVVDTTDPEIKLLGSNLEYITLNTTYTDPGFKAEDAYDGDITANVVVDGTVDSTNIGKYEITYTVTDSSGNKATTIRTVEVLDKNILTASIGDFWLDGYFDNVVLHYEETEYPFFDETVFLGDSNSIYLWYRGDLTTEWQTWGRFNCNIAQINYSLISTYADWGDHYLSECFDLYHPKYLIINVGVDSRAFSKDEFIEEVTYLINWLKTNHPETYFAFTSIFPVTKTSTLGGDSQDEINKHNYYLMELCYKYKCNYINFADVVRGEDGYGNDAYYENTGENDRGFHLNQAGRELYVDYIKHLNLEREIN